MFKINLMLMDIYAFADRTFTLMLAYRRRSMQMQEVIRMLQYFLATISIDIIAGDFNFDILKESENKLSDILTPFPDSKQTSTYIWIFDRACLYHENFDGRIFQLLKRFTFHVMIL